MEEDRVQLTYWKKNSKKTLGRWEKNTGLDPKKKYVSLCTIFDSAQDKLYWRAMVNATFILRVS